MDGIAATFEITRRHTMPIIGLTANADEETHVESKKAGMKELLTKPVSTAELKMAIERYPVPIQAVPPEQVKPHDRESWEQLRHQSLPAEFRQDVS